MMYKVFYDIGHGEGWYYEVFDNFLEALQFANKQVESYIVGFNQIIPLSYNINLIY